MEADKSLLYDNLSESRNNSVTKCVEWLQRTSIERDDESTCTDISDSSSFSTFSNEIDKAAGTMDCYVGNRELFLNDEVSHEKLESIVTQSQNVYANINVTKSKNVHLGNVVYINGPVHINQTSTVINQQTTINQYMNANNDDESKPPSIVARTYWLAQPPAEPHTYLSAPAKFVIISHSASEEAYTQPANVLLVRLIQQFHIESRLFGDIAYNFLLGGDGNIYEGRGWNVIGAHTQGFNRMSIGICFIGCFSMKLPSSKAIAKAKRLIEFGVQKGYIDKEYTLLGHCQCTNTESPGRILFREMKTWERFDSNVSVDTPPALPDWPDT